jgi:rod shape-determining protein MreC
VLGAGLYPLQRAALVPRDVFMGAADLAVTSATLRSENDKLRAKDLQLAQQANTAAELAAENTHLRALLQLSQRSTTQSLPAEIQYDTRDPFTQKVVIGRGAQQGVQDGSPVVNEDGVIGQVTRVFPLQAEVTLLTDKDQAVPVQIVRTGLRSVIYGTPKGDTLDLRFVPAEKQATPAKPAEKPSAKTAAAEKKAAGEKKPAAEKAEKNTKPPATPGAQP